MYLAPGTVLPGGIEIGGRLGGGGHGTVYYARRAGADLALKVLNAPSAETARRLVQEAAMLQRLDHPNIVPLVEILEVGGHPAFLSKLAPAGSLAQLLGNCRLRLQDEALPLFRGVVAGVAHAHAHRILHRDLKPANVLLTRTRDGYLPWVADFGVARFLDVTAHTAFAVGTPGYMAPEVATNPRDLDDRVDVFGLGCILHELACGRPAFPQAGATTLETPDANLPQPVLAALHGCLELRREARIASCSELLAVLDGRARRAPPRLPSPATWRPATRLPAERKPLAVRVGVVAVAGGALGLTLVWPTPPPSPPAPSCGLLTRLGVSPPGVEVMCASTAAFESLLLTGPGADGACVAVQRALLQRGARLVDQADTGADLSTLYAWDGAGVTLLCRNGSVEVEAAAEPLGIARP